jgi:hypothetical protein
MGPDIHPYPEGSEDALMVCTHIAGQVFCENGRVWSWGYGQDPAVMQEHVRAGIVTHCVCEVCVLKLKSSTLR